MRSLKDEALSRMFTRVSREVENSKFSETRIELSAGLFLISCCIRVDDVGKRKGLVL
jgi:hypothetical protein